MGSGCLVDSNVIVDFSKDLLPAQQVEFLYTTELFVCDVVRIEVLGYNALEEESNRLERFFGNVYSYPLSEEVVNRAIALRKTHKIKLGDAVIAATALVYGLDLITRNTADFKGIDGLMVIDSHS